MDGCVSLFRCDKGMRVSETSQCFAVAKAVIGISDGICNAFFKAIPAVETGSYCMANVLLFVRIYKNAFHGVCNENPVQCIQLSLVNFLTSQPNHFGKELSLLLKSLVACNIPRLYASFLIISLES